MPESQMSPDERRRANEVRRNAYAKQAPKFDKSMGFFERHVFGTEHRSWACSRAHGRTLEVAVGSGLNLAFYPQDVSLVGIDLSPEMLALAKERARSLGTTVELKEGDAHQLPFEDGSFDSVVCTYSLCNIPDARQAVAEMKRVLKQGGKLILVDHIRSSAKPVYWIQKTIEFFTRRSEGEFMTRRSLPHVEAVGLEVEERQRMRTGLVERIVAVNPPR